MRGAVENKSAHTTVFTIGDDIRASREVEGFDGKIVAMIGPECISACDRQSLLLAKSRRAVLLGTTSNGTGAGYRTSSPYSSTHWEDARSHALALEIPNALWGQPGQVGQHEYTEPRDYYRFNSENIPTKAQVEHAPTLKDFLNGGQDIFERAMGLLEQ